MIGDVVRRVPPPKQYSDEFTAVHADLHGQQLSGGQGVWRKVVGGTMSSDGSAASSTASTDTIYVVDVGRASYKASYTPQGNVGGDCLYFRVVDPDNWWRVRLYSYTQSSGYYITQYYHSWSKVFSSEQPPNCPMHNHSTTVGVWSYSTAQPTTPVIPHADYPNGHSGCATPHAHSTNTYPAVYQGITNTSSVYVPGGTSYHKTLYLERKVSGTVTQVQSVAAGETSAPGEISVKVAPGQVQVSVNGITQLTSSDAVNGSGTGVGIGRGAPGSPSASRIVEFRVD